MDGISLHDFYRCALLPQFAISDESIQWGETKRLEGDEIIHPFTIDGRPYVLLFEDYARSGRTANSIDGFVLPSGTKFKLVEPIIHTALSPSYDSRQLTGPARYRENVTGVFTLIELLP